MQACYTPLPDELEWARRSTRGERPRLGLLVLLKVFQQLHYFPVLGVIPGAIVDHVRAVADISDATRFGCDTTMSPTLFRHYSAVRAYLGVKPYYGTDANAIATRAAHTASLTMDQPVDIINATIDELISRNIELPAFSTLDRLTEQIHARAQSRLFKRVTRRLTDEQKLVLDRLLARDLSSRQTAYNRIKRHAKRPSRQHLEQLIAQIAWLDELGDFSLALAGISASKLRSLAQQAMALDASALRNDTLPEKRYTLSVAAQPHARARPRRPRRHVRAAHGGHPQAGERRAGCDSAQAARSGRGSGRVARRRGRHPCRGVRRDRHQGSPKNARAQRRSGVVARELRGDSCVQRPQLPATALEALQGAPLGHDACRQLPRVGFDQPGSHTVGCTRRGAGKRNAASGVDRRRRRSELRGAEVAETHAALPRRRTTDQPSLS
nr:DUF4158 domain-containing protein [Burkholderia sp. MSMB0856]